VGGFVLEAAVLVDTKHLLAQVAAALLLNLP
jgi:hypothetical protein